MSALTIDTVTDLVGTVQAMAVFRTVWGSTWPLDTDTYFAAASHGSYLAIARSGGEAVGASFAFLSDGGRGLHSHCTCAREGLASSGIGRALKFHQAAWACERGIEHITWTYDPLVRRNAWFNLAVLGARVTSFHENYYGALGDAMNGDDESDRFEVRWDIGSAPVRVSVDVQRTVDPAGGDLVVAIPADIVALRTSDPEQARRLRRSLRESLEPVALGTHRVAGVTHEGSYVLTAR